MTHHNEQGDTIMGDAAIRKDVDSIGATGTTTANDGATSTIQLNDAVKRIAELDAKRTQGEWIAEQAQSYCEPHQIEFYYGIQVRENGKYKESIVDNEGTDLTNYPNAPYDFSFIAAAPLMAATVARQAAIIEQQRAVMEMAREALRGLHNDVHEYATINNLGGFDNHWMRGARTTLIALDAALGRV